MAFGRLTFFFTALLLITQGCQRSAPVNSSELEIDLAGRTFTLELALTDEQRRQGLSGRKSMASDRGMLFVFPDERIVQFHMIDCHFPIDVMFIGETGRIASHYTMQTELGVSVDELKNYSSRWPIRYAIELNGGQIAELGLKNGDRIELPLDDLKARAR